MSASEKIRIVFLIRSLEIGGAERQLVELVKGLDSNFFSIQVITFYDKGSLQQELEKREIPVISLHKKGRWEILSFIHRLYVHLYRFRPHIVHGYMGIANELSLILGKMLDAKVIWGIRSSNMDFHHYDWLPRLSFRISAWLSPFVDLIIVNSEAGRLHHIRWGYSPRYMVVIPNGIDTVRFSPNKKARERTRKEWKISQDSFAVGMVARLDPIKGYPVFLQAASLFLHKNSKVVFICIGKGTASYQKELHSLSQRLGLSPYIRWIDEYSDISAAYNALDVFSLTSDSEGFPNAIAEAMASGVPVVVTDVGDAAKIVGNTGEIVPRQDPQKIAQSWEKIFCLPSYEREKIGIQARERIIQHFSNKQLIKQSQDYFVQLYKKDRRKNR